MRKLPKAIHTVGRVWIWLAVSYILLSYFLNLIFSKEPIAARILVFINFWNVLFALLIILPGHILTEVAEKIANRYGDSFEKAIEKNQSKIILFFNDLFELKILFPVVVLGYLILMFVFVISHTGYAVNSTTYYM